MDDRDAAHAPTVAPIGVAATAASTGDSHADTLAAGVGGPAAPAVPDGARYQLGPTIGAGGMGEVVSASDRRIGRDVAVKRTRGVPGPELAARFLREAQIQGRLDHPAIVPVYDLGVDDHGRPYFVMKRWPAPRWPTCWPAARPRRAGPAAAAGGVRRRVPRGRVRAHPRA